MFTMAWEVPIQHHPTIATALGQPRRQQKRCCLRDHGVLREPREGIHRDGLSASGRVVETGAAVVELALQAIPGGRFGKDVQESKDENIGRMFNVSKKQMMFEKV